MMCHRCPCRILAYRALLIPLPLGAPVTSDLKLQGRFFAETSPLIAGFLRYRRSSDYLYGISHRFHRDRSKVGEEEEVVRTVGSFRERRVHSGRVRNSSSSRHNYLDRSRTVSLSERRDFPEGTPSRNYPRGRNPRQQKESERNIYCARFSSERGDFPEGVPL
jgi:hypothetical protein